MSRRLARFLSTTARRSTDAMASTRWEIPMTLRPRTVSCRLVSVLDSDDSVHIQGTSDQSLVVPLVWLRDHCTSPKLFNHATNQRRTNVTRLSVDSQAHSVEVVGNEHVVVQWKDGHRSTYPVDTLLRNSRRDGGERQMVPSYRKLWSRSNFAMPTFERSSLDLGQFYTDFVQYGVAMIRGVEPNAEATEALCREISPIHDTFYGSFWVFSNDVQHDGSEYHEDTAYGSEEIGPHTDGTYFNQTPGIQVFHCLHRAKVGGDTQIVDGFSAVELLRQKSPEAFHILSTTKIEHNYMEGHGNRRELYSVSLEKPVIELDSNGRVVQFRFNPFDRAPMRTLSVGDDSVDAAAHTIAFYKAYEELSQLCNDPRMIVTMALQPGEVIFIDNFRALHARTAFQGYRQMCGCYMSRDNLLAKARPYLPENVQRFL